MSEEHNCMNDFELTNEELAEEIRSFISDEYKAVQTYMQLARVANNKLVTKVLTDVANEERIHAGEFLALLKNLAPDEQKFYDEGAKEVEEMKKEIGK